MRKTATKEEQFNANRLLDYVVEKMGVKNDAALSRQLGVTPPVISKLRHGTLPVASGFVLRIHDVSGIAIRKLKELAGMKCLTSLVKP